MQSDGGIKEDTILPCIPERSCKGLYKVFKAPTSDTQSLGQHISSNDPALESSIMADDCSRVTGYIDPNWPRPDDDDSACIIIFG